MRQVLRKPQVDAVVNGHDVGASDEPGDDVVRRMEEIDARVPQRQRNAPLLGDRVMCRPLGQRLEPRAERLDERAVALPAQDDVVVVISASGERLDEVADVGANAEVVQLAGVDGNAQGRASA